MWVKAYDVSGCFRGEWARCEGTGPVAIDETAACRNTCPLSPGRGMDLDPVGGRFAWVMRPR
jgi:hypothetical protein